MTTMMRRTGQSAVLLTALLASLTIPGGAAAPSPRSSPGPVLMQASGRGNPHINLRDGRAISSGFSGDAGAVSARSHPATVGLALASADFDEDGTPDLVASYETSDGGLLSLHFGNVDAIHPNAPEAKRRRSEGTFTDAPFLPEARLFETPDRPDVIGAGDFDADGHADIVTAQEGGTALTLHRGDGTGGFHPHESLPLPGAVTELATGEINRRDGYADFVIGIVAQGVAQALVFQSHDGALAAPPRVIGLPAPATDIVLGQMDGRYPFDMAVAAGNHLVRIGGIDRTTDPLAAHVVEDVPLPVRAMAVAVADFDGDGRSDLALLDDVGALRLAAADEPEAIATAEASPAAASSGVESRPRMLRAGVAGRGDGLLVVGRDERQIEIVRAGGSGDPGASIRMQGQVASAVAMRLNADALDDLVILPRDNPTRLVIVPTGPLMTFVVTNTLDSGAGSLRQAILSANGAAGLDTINFSIAGAGPHVIQPATPLPTITSPVLIDGTSEPDYVTVPVVELDGRVGASAHGLRVTAGGSTISGLAIVGFKPPAATGGHGIFIETGGSNIVEDCYIGVSVAGASPPGNGLVGLMIFNSAGNQVLRNVISGNNANGLQIAGAVSGMNIVRGNLIGTSPAGTVDRGNGNHGLLIGSAPDNTVGGAALTDRNIISGNASDGIAILNAGATGNLIQNNHIGTNASGSLALANDFHGIEIFIAGGNTVGGRGPTAPMTRNLISGNGEDGILIAGGATANTVEGNYIGTDVSGMSPLPNSLHGIRLSGDASSNTIGGLPVARHNRIAFNGMAGVFVEEGTSNSIRGNAIFSNGALGIDLAPTGGALNDPMDPDSGPNRLQNFPVITDIRTTGGSILIDAGLNSEPGLLYPVDFFANPVCDASGRGEGARYLGSVTTGTDSTGNVSFSDTMIVAVAAGEEISATANHPDGSTSEFSACTTAVRAPAPVPRSASMPSSAIEMGWESVAGAQTYTLYRGVETDLPNLSPPPSLAPPINSCIRWSGTTTGTGPILTEVPPPGGLYWYLATATGIFGESGGGEGSGGPRELNPSGPCPGATCPHDKCIEGVALQPSCGGCVADICAADPFCCNTAWDNFCVEEARTLCGSLTCLESRGQCNHTLCSFGPALAPKCDVPPLPQSCVDSICAADPFCCEDHWDAVCIQEVVSVCGFNCD